MDYENERWMKVYLRDTASWLAKSWQARGLGILLDRHAEPATGEISLGSKGLAAAAALLRAPWEEIRVPLQELLDEGDFEYDEERQVLRDPQHPARQGAKAAPTVRKQMQRARDVTRGHAPSRGATPSHDQREREKEETEERDARAPVREDETEPEPAPAAPAEEPELGVGELIPLKPPEWFAEVVDAVRLATGEDIDHRVAWSRYSGHRAKTGKPMNPMDARYFVTTVDVVEAKRERMLARERIARRDEDEHRQAARARRGMSPALPVPKTAARARLAAGDDDAHVHLFVAAERARELAVILGTGT